MNYEAKYTIDSHNLILKTITYSELLLFICQKCFRMIKNSFCQMWTCLNTKTSSHKTLMASSCCWNVKHVYQLLYFTSEYQVNWKNLTLHALTYTSHAFLEEEVEAQRLCQHTDFFLELIKYLSGNILSSGDWESDFTPSCIQSQPWLHFMNRVSNWNRLILLYSIPFVILYKKMLTFQCLKFATRLGSTSWYP